MLQTFRRRASRIEAGVGFFQGLEKPRVVFSKPWKLLARGGGLCRVMPHMLTRFQIWSRRGAAILSGALLATAFPPLDWSGVVFFALVPLLLVLRGESAGGAFRLGWLAGATQWLVTVFWLHHVSWGGWVGLAFYCALYPGFFALIAAALWRGCGENRLGRFFLPPVLAVAWAGLEWIRGTFGTGFAWLPLAASQHLNLPLLQLAGWGGAYLVSALIVWLNVALAVTVCAYSVAPPEASPDLATHRTFRWGEASRRAVHTELLFALVVLAVALAYGWRVLRTPQDNSTLLKVALVQPAIPQMDKWTPEMVETIYNRLRELTKRARVESKSDLVIWPETAVPDDIRSSQASYDVVFGLVTNGTPILLGSTDTLYLDSGKARYFNSTFLFSTNGVIAGTYDKQHLVAFGEYIPPLLGWLTPIEDSFTPGTTSFVFRLARPAVDFSTLICFEDTVAEVARGFVLAGARLLVNMSNDAWFDPSAASHQHMLHSVLRAVENRVPVVRCCNTGVSCCIDRFGRVYDAVAAAQAVSGFQNTVVAVPDRTAPLTFFAQHGDWFGPGAASVAGLLTLGALWRRRKEGNN
ncbi:MAG: apolipoprotein N-acyltransferase [Verrucomicrobia bacterium]|nr:MAG: apolipoprotein N-acyltransferase [Verrucomicrobiota bacterium]